MRQSFQKIFRCIPAYLQQYTTLLFILISVVFVTRAIAADIPGGEESNLFHKPSEFELERMAPRRDLEMLSTNLAGEHISLADGGLSFSATDIIIPLNMQKNLSISRIYNRLAGLNDIQASEFSNWQLDLPRIETNVLEGDVRWTPNYYSASACRNVINPGPIMAAQGHTVQQHEYWNGATLIIPEQGGGKLLTGNSYGQYQTLDNMIIDCAVEDNNEYFVVKSPQGLTYKLKQRRTIQSEPLFRGFKPATRKRLIYSVTDIEDRFGNRLSYQYQGNNLLEYIKYTAVGKPEETLATFNYTNGLISSINALGKIWRYQYESGNLKKVVLPDNKFWLYQFPTFSNYAPKIVLNEENISAAYNCDYEVEDGSSMAMSVTHPQGAVATFNYKLAVHGRTEVPAASMMPISSNSTHPLYNINACYGILAISKKQLTVNGTTYTWNYDFSNNEKHWNINNFNGAMWFNNNTAYRFFNDGDFYGNQKSSACANNNECKTIPTSLGYEPFDLRVLTVTEPDNSMIKYYISKRWDHTDGKVVATQWFNSSNVNDLVTTEKKAFTVSAAKGDSGMTDGIASVNSIPESRPILLSNRVIQQNGDTYTTSFDEYNDYGAVIQSHAYNSISADKKYTRQEYQHDTNNWLLNLPTKQKLSSNGNHWTTYQENTYYSPTHAYKTLPYQSKTFGEVMLTNTEYHSDGNIKKRLYTGTNRYQIFEEYKRGKAQKVTLPCAETNGCNTANASTTNTVIAKLDVNNDGTIKSVTDFKGNKTSYEYNDIGWLTKIDPADSKWHNTSISYSQVSVSDDGLSGSNVKVGQLKQVITKGNYEKRIYLDSMLRPTFTREIDKSATSTARYQKTSYNHNNQVSFLSFPSGSATANHGVETTYDVLGRATKTTRNSDGAITQVRYLTGNKVEVTDPRYNVTTTTYLAYGSPSQLKPKLIASPLSVNTQIDYNNFDQIISINQGGITENRYYDSKQQLCKIARPDTGNTAFGYNAKRQMIWRAEGASGNTTSCDLASVLAAEKTSLAYNNQNVIQAVNYADTNINKSYQYNENGQLKTLATGRSTWRYDYDSAGNLSYESLGVDNKNLRLNYQYSNMGFVNEITYPSSRKVAINSNALGMPTSIGTYATNVKYHPNGQVAQFTYGNGVVRDIKQDTTGRTDTLKDLGGVENVISLDVGYDKNDNITSLINIIDNRYNLTGFSYDGLDRLTGVNGKFSSASFDYDSLGNIEAKTLGSTTINYHYNGSNRLTSVSGSINQGFDYDNKGNVINNGRFALDFNNANQVISANGNSYLYDGYNRRIKQQNANVTKYSMYSLAGQLYHQIDESSGLATDHIYLGTQLIAKINNGLSKPVMNSLAVSPDGNFTFSWQAVTGATRYELEENISPGSWLALSSSTGLSGAKSGYANGDHGFRVRACNALACSSYTNFSVTVLFPPPTPASITLPSGVDKDGNYNINWATTSRASSYVLRESHNNGASWTTVHTPTGVSQNISGKENGAYRYGVQACNISGCSDYKSSSNSVTVLLPPPVPAAITTPTGTDIDGAFTVSWGSSNTASSYKLERRINGGNWTALSTQTSTSKAISGKANGTYAYRVQACNSSGCSGYKTSSTFTVLLPPPTPSSISTPTGTDIDGAFTVTWAVSSTATSYTLAQSVNGGSWSYTTLTGSSKAYSGKTNATYRYAIRACNASGCSGYRYSSTFTVLLPPPVPGSASVPSSDYDGSYTVSWSAASTATKYTLLERVNGGSWSTLTSSHTSTTYSRSGRGNATYQYAVKACNTSGCSGWKYTGILTNTLPPSSVSVPSVDTNGSYTVSWDSVATRTRYILQEKTGSGSWVTLNSNLTGLSYSRTGRANTTYQYRVAACNSKGCSGYRTSGVITNLNTPSSITYGTKDHDGAFTVSWASVGTATSYTLQQKLGSTWSTVYVGSARSKALSGLGNGTYTYRVKACKGSSCTSYRTGSNTMWVIKPNLGLSWSPSYLLRPGSASLTWNAIGADRCSNRWIGSNAAGSGSRSLPLSGTVTETVTCYFGSLSITRSRQIIVKYSGGGGGGIDF